MATGQQVNERLAAITEAGTSIWLDQVRRSLVETGELQAHGRGGVAARRHVEPGHLREGDPRLSRLRRPARRAGQGRRRHARHLPRDGRARHPGRLRRPAPRLRRDRPLRRLRLARGRPRPRLRHRPDQHAGPRVLGRRRPPQPHDQDPGHRRGRPGDRAADLRGAQHQRHAALRGRRLRAHRRGVHPRHGAPPRRGQGPRRPLGRLVLRLARGQRGRQAPGEARPRGPAGPRGPGQRARRLQALQDDLPRRALRDAARGGRPGATAAVGVDRGEEPEVLRHHVRRRADRPRTPSTRCRWRRCRRRPTTPGSRAPPPTRTPRPTCRRWPRRASTSTTSRPSCSRTASTPSSPPWRSCWSASSPSGRRSSPRARRRSSRRCPTTSSRRSCSASRRPRRRTSHGASGARTRRSGAARASPSWPTASAG